MELFKEIAKLVSSPARLRLIKFFAFQPNSRFESSEVAAALGLSKRSADFELRTLVKAKLVLKKTQGKKNYYWYSDVHPYAEPLRVFLERTTLPNDKVIVNAFKGSGASLIVITGTLTRDTRSPLDILVVTRRPKHPKIARAIRRLETWIAVPLRYAILETGEYKSRLEANDRLLRDVFDFSYRTVVGRA